ncbi:hypothetical protein AAVH_02411 [Aphelenchoides avenae]|nr:hypothetical protein AAVH_02411 [Aphelenchus avenae]
MRSACDAKATSSRDSIPFDRIPTLSKALRGYECFLNAQRSLFTVEHPSSLFSNNEYILTTKLENLKNERNRIPLLFSMLNDFYAPFFALDVESKITLLEHTCTSLRTLNNTFLTSQVFPEASDTRYVMSCGYYADIARYAEYMAGSVPDDSIEGHVRIKMPMLKDFRSLVTKMVRAGVRMVDTAALMGLVLWTDAERNGMLTEHMEQHKEAIINDWSEELCATYGPQNGCRQMGKLMNLLVDVREVTSKIQETVIIAHIFKPDEIRAWAPVASSRAHRAYRRLKFVSFSCLMNAM